MAAHPQSQPRATPPERAMFCGCFEPHFRVTGTANGSYAAGKFWIDLPGVLFFDSWVHTAAQLSKEYEIVSAADSLRIRCVLNISLDKGIKKSAVEQPRHNYMAQSKMHEGSPSPDVLTCRWQAGRDIYSSTSSLLTATYTKASARTLECEVATSLESSTFD